MPTATALNTTSIRVSWPPISNGSYHDVVVSTNGSKETVDNSTHTAVLVGLIPGTLYTITIEVVYFNASSELVEIQDVATCK